MILQQSLLLQIITKTQSDSTTVLSLGTLSSPQSRVDTRARHSASVSTVKFFSKEVKSTSSLVRRRPARSVSPSCNFCWINGFQTSVLMALLGEMYYKAHNIDSWYNLPRDGSIAYAAQESWVLNETIRVCLLLLSSPDPYS